MVTIDFQFLHGFIVQIWDSLVLLLLLFSSSFLPIVRIRISRAAGLGIETRVLVTPRAIAAHGTMCHQPPVSGSSPFAIASHATTIHMPPGPHSSFCSPQSRACAHPTWDDLVYWFFRGKVSLNLKGIFPSGNDLVSSRLWTKHQAKVRYPRTIPSLEPNTV